VCWESLYICKALVALLSLQQGKLWVPLLVLGPKSLSFLLSSKDFFVSSLHLLASRHPRLPSSRILTPACHLEESPPEENDDEQCQSTDWPVLLQQQIPVDPYRGLAVLLGILSQSGTDFAHALQAITSVQQVLDVLGHDFRDILELGVQLVQILRRAGIGICGLGALDEGVEFHECVWSERGCDKLLVGVGGAEFRGEVGEVGKC
jgi:hypothetical protein